MTELDDLLNDININMIILENRPIMQKLIENYFSGRLKQKIIDNINNFHVVKFCDNGFLLDKKISQHENYLYIKDIINIMHNNTRIDLMCEDGAYRSGKMEYLLESDGYCVIELHENI